MVVKKLFILLVGGCLSSICFGQNFSYDESVSDYSRTSLICVWQTGTMYAVPGEKATELTVLYFGEKLTSLDEEHYNKADQTVYLKVEGADGKTGWIEEDAVIEGERTVMVLDRSRVYLRPQTVSTITDQFFEKGELAIMSGRYRDWVQLTGKGKNKSGWIRGKENVSTSTNDIQLAVLIEKAMQEEDVLIRKEKLLALSRQASGANHLFSDMIADKSSEAVGNLPLMAETDLQRTRGGVVWDSSIDLLKPEEPRAINSELYRKRITNPITRETTEYIVEIGAVSEIEPPVHVQTIYFAYHKTLPTGSRIQLDIPDNSGFVELEIVGRLPKEKHGIIGLSRICMETVFGTNNPKSATISYKNHQ